MDKTPIKRIEFEQVEGLTEDCQLHVFTSWSEVEAHVFMAARKAPSDGSYFKCDVGIEWADGTTRGFRFDMNRKHGQFTFPVSNELHSELLFYSGRWCPTHMTPADRDGFLDYIDSLNPGVRERAAKILDTCDIGSAPTRTTVEKTDDGCTDGPDCAVCLPTTHERASS